MILAVISATYTVVMKRPEQDLNLDLCDASAVLHQLSDHMICLSSNYKCKDHLHHNKLFSAVQILEFLVYHIFIIIIIIIQYII